jgi:hypothetical protein
MRSLWPLIQTISLVIGATAAAQTQSSTATGSNGNTVAGLHTLASVDTSGSGIVYAGSSEAPAPDPNLPTMTEWYGLTTLAVDGAAIAVTAIGLTAPNYFKADGIFVGTGLVAYAMGAPIVHISKGEYGSAAGSFALRVGIMLPSLALGLVTPKSTGLATAIASGMGVAAVIDAFALAYRQVPVTPVARSWLNYIPSIAVNQNTTTLYFSGQF